MRLRTNRTSVIAYSIDSAMISYRPVVDVRNVRVPHVVAGAVVIEVIVIPMAAFVTVAEVAEAVIDTAVEADVPAPIAGMPEIHAARPAPIAWRPEQSNLGWQHPGTGYPVIAVVSPCPIAWYPDIPRSGYRRLLVHGELRRCNAGRQTNAHRRHGGRRRKHEQQCQPTGEQPPAKVDHGDNPAA